MNVAINDMQAYLADRYCGWATEQGMFLKLVEELGEVAEVINKRAGIKPSDDEDLKEQLASELADMLHYIVAIAGINNIDLEKAIIEKDRVSSLKYGHSSNLELYLKEKQK
ncbi:MAG: nucleotide pyrophosphohydrolase [Clostridia bacterium]|nr:nucleotide pyrophosphohydrolase [Clostridia bacterium]